MLKLHYDYAYNYDYKHGLRLPLAKAGVEDATFVVHCSYPRYGMPEPHLAIMPKGCLSVEARKENRHMSIFVKDSGLKVAFSLEDTDGAVEYPQADLEAFRAALVEAGQVSPKHEYMLRVWDKNGVLSIKTSNRFAKTLRQIAKATKVTTVPKGKRGKKATSKKAQPAASKKQARKQAEVKPETELVAAQPSMEDIMAAAEQENARRDAELRDAFKAFIMASDKKEQRKRSLISELGL